YNFATAHDLQHGANPEQVLFLNTNDGTSNNPNVGYIADQSNGVLKFWLNNVTITSLSDNGSGLVTVTTSGNHNLLFDSPGTDPQKVQISGASDQTFNGTFTLLSASGNTFTFQRTYSGAPVNATGGTAAQWEFGRVSDQFFGQKLVFSGGATGL